MREAAQALLLAELGRIGPKGRKALVDNWAQYLPQFSSAEVNAPAQHHIAQTGQVCLSMAEITLSLTLCVTCHFIICFVLSVVSSGYL